jgi:hypothetical protein
MEKRLTLVSPWDAQMRVWRRRDLRAHLKAIGLAWARVRWTP